MQDSQAVRHSRTEGHSQIDRHSHTDHSRPDVRCKILGHRRIEERRSHVPQKNQDILSRAKQNVQENNEDLLKNADRMQHEAARGAADTPILTPSEKVAMQGVKPVGQQIGADFDDDCDIMQKLNDLMIMGYSGNLEFDRDFICRRRGYVEQLSGIWKQFIDF